MPPYTFQQVKAWRHDVKSWIRLCGQCHVAVLQSAMLDVPAIPTSVSFLCQPTLIYSRGDTRLACLPLLACQACTERTVGPDIQCHYLLGHECSIPWRELLWMFLSRYFRTFLKCQSKKVIKGAPADQSVRESLKHTLARSAFSLQTYFHQLLSNPLPTDMLSLPLFLCVQYLDIFEFLPFPSIITKFKLCIKNIWMETLWI